MLLPVLWPVEPLDCPDLRCLNSNHAPLPHPFAHPFNIKLYNEMWLSDPILSMLSQLIATRPTVVHIAESEHAVEGPANENIADSVDSAFQSTKVSTANGQVENSDVVLPEQAVDPAVFFWQIGSSFDRLFFISFRLPGGTLRAKWFLVAVDLPQTYSDVARCGDPAISGTDFVHFYGRHPSDESDSDCEARWWPLWHKCTVADDGVINYGKRVLIPPAQNVNQKQLSPWGEHVN